jgi:ribonucleotide reductase beta subunit family protein with ferritin-like domain
VIILNETEKERRDTFLCKVYNYAHRIPDKWVPDINSLANDLGYNDDELVRFAYYFKDKGCVDIRGTKDHPVTAIKITPYGVEYVENLDREQLM